VGREERHILEVVSPIRLDDQFAAPPLPSEIQNVFIDGRAIDARAGSPPRSGPGSPTRRGAGPSATRRPSRCSGPRVTTSRRCVPSPTVYGAKPSATASPTS
jgi:hypothetical protein